MRRNLTAAIMMGTSMMSLCVGCTPSPEKHLHAPFQVAEGSSVARLTPVVVVRAKSPIRVPFALTNSTKEELTYAVDSDGGELCLLGCLMYCNGSEVTKGRVEYDRPRLQKEQIRRLKPETAVILHFQLPFVEVKQGRYELRLIYEVFPKSAFVNEFGLTAMKLEQTIILDVKDE